MPASDLLGTRSFDIPSMATPQVHTHFIVKSGHLCYGELHNIWQGASAEPCHGLTAVQPKSVGTVLAHELDHNVAALNGTWNAFQLIDTTNERLAGWFVANESVNVLQEIDKILRISGSPYEDDSGSIFNDEKTTAEGVLVINRYDWGHYDERALDVVEEQGENEERDPSTFVFGISAGLVDYAEAKAEVRFWKDRPEDARAVEQRPHGLWMHVPYGEYNFGRFGFNEEHSAARSFLLFSMHTFFTRTVIAGMQQPLRKEETHEERFQRRLREGFDFRGMETLNMMSKSSPWGPRPADGDWLGPYADNERLFLEADVRAVLRQNVNRLEFVDPWRERVESLLNELLMSYLERYIVPHGRLCHTVLAAAEALTPQRNKRKTVDFYLFQHLTQPDADPIPDWDATTVAERGRAFLFSRGGEERGLFKNDEYIAGLCRCLAWLLGEVLHLAINGARDSYRSNIMPVDIRMAIQNDGELFSIFKFSRVYWEGSE